MRRSGLTALSRASNMCQLKANARCLLHGINGETIPEKEIKDFHEAVASGNEEKVQTLLSCYGLGNARNSKGWTPLMVAARKGNVGLIEILLKNMGSTFVLSPSGHTATEFAAFWQHKQAYELLKAASKDEAEPQGHYFSNYPLDIKANLRDDHERLYKVAQMRNSKFIIFVKNTPLVVPINKQKTRFALFTRSLPQVQSVMNSDVLDQSIFLGCHKGENVVGLDILEDVEPAYQQGGAWFAITVSETQAALLTSANEEASALLNGPPHGLPNLEPADAALFGKATSLLSWRHTSKYCTLCGEPTTVSQTGYKLQCSNNSCKSHRAVMNVSHPRTDPSIITLVVSEDDKHCLLARQPRFPAKMYSCLAGFVEPCESLESACQREVEEEVGLRLSRVTYHSSQPWPTPSTLMLGFIAYAKQIPPTIDSELEDAQWFSRQDAVGLMTRTHPKGYFTPPAQAIAHHLIKHWLITNAFA